MSKTVVSLSCAVVLAALSFLLSDGGGSALAQGNGPRSYQLLPEGSDSFSQFALWMDGNNTPTEGLVIKNADIDMTLGVSQFATTFGIAGHQAGLLGILPYGQVSGSLTSNFPGRERTGGDSGFGDFMLGFAYGVIGAPVLSPEAYAAYDPGFAVSAIAYATAPTGSYSSNRILNMGGNRWAFDLELPLMYYAGSSYLDPHLTSFELTPKVTFFTDNPDAPGRTDVLGQAPIYALEGHVTRNFGQGFWASFDALYEYGGETSSDGVPDDNLQESLSLGATANFNIGRSGTFKLTYGKTVAGNADGSDGQMVRALFMVLF